MTKPNLIIGFGANHRCLEGRGRTPILFTKSNNCLLQDGGTIEVPADTSMIWAEVELAVVIARRTKHVAYEDAPAHIMGFTVANDVNRLNIYKRSEDLAFGKCCDTFLPLLPGATAVDPRDLRARSYVNGELVQDCTSADLIFDVWRCVSYASRYCTLDEGDVILTGTSCGAKRRPLRDGDVVVCEIDGIGRLTSHVHWQKEDRRHRPTSPRQPTLPGQEPASAR